MGERTTRRTVGALTGVAAAALASGALAAPSVVSLDRTGVQGPAPAAGAAISADGRYVAFTSLDPLAGLPTGGVRQLYVRDTTTGATVLASSAAGVPANQPVDAQAALSGDGRYAVFATQATNLTAEADDGQRDVFRTDLVTGAVELVSAAADGGPANAAVDGRVDVSDDGAFVAYATGAATNLWTGDSDPASDVVVRDLRARTTTLASATSAGGPFAAVTGVPALSGDGRRVATVHAGIVAVRDLGAATTTDVGAGSAPDLSGDGTRVVYVGATTLMTARVGSAPVALAVGTQPRLTADGTRVAFSDAGRVRIQPTGGGAAQDAVAPAHAASAPQLAANGAAVAFDLNDGPAPSASPATGDGDLAADVLLQPLVPTDLAAPTLTVAAIDPVSPAQTVVVQGRATDVSGIAWVSVDGFVARLAADGAFAVTLTRQIGLVEVPVVARDISGNVVSTRVTVTRSAPDPFVPPVPSSPPLTRSPRLINRARGAWVNYRLESTVNIARVQILRLRGVRYRPFGSPSAVPFAAGAHTVKIRKARLSRGTYRVQVTVVSPTWGLQTRSSRLVVR